MSRTHRWQGVEIRHLAALRAVADTRSFAAAGARLGYSQSAISLQIAALEKIAGTRLLERPGGRRPVTLTAAGEQIVRHARQLTDHLQVIEADLTALAGGQAGSVTLGTFPSASRHLLPDALRSLRATHPQVSVHLDDASHADQQQRLADATTDLTLGLAPFDGPFGIRELLRDPYVFIAAIDALPHRGLPTVPELARLPLISWRRPPLGSEDLLVSHGYEPRVVLRSDDSAAVQRFVAHGLGVAILPRLTLDLPDASIVAVDATPLLPPRRVVLARHRDRQLSAAAQALERAISTAAEHHRRIAGRSLAAGHPAARPARS